MKHCKYISILLLIISSCSISSTNNVNLDNFIIDQKAKWKDNKNNYKKIKEIIKSIKCDEECKIFPEFTSSSIISINFDDVEVITPATENLLQKLIVDSKIDLIKFNEDVILISGEEISLGNDYKNLKYLSSQFIYFQSISSKVTKNSCKSRVVKERALINCQTPLEGHWFLSTNFSGEV